MPANTSRGYPYPLTTDPVSVPADIQSLATALNTDVGTVATTATAAQARSTLTAKGDLYVATASATTTRLGVGSNGQVLVADSSTVSGVRWSDEGDQQEIALIMGIY
jgi:hypothetical protein